MGSIINMSNTKKRLDPPKLNLANIHKIESPLIQDETQFNLQSNHIEINDEKAAPSRQVSPLGSAKKKKNSRRKSAHPALTFQYQSDTKEVQQTPNWGVAHQKKAGFKSKGSESQDYEYVKKEVKTVPSQSYSSNFLSPPLAGGLIKPIPKLTGASSFRK